MADNLERRDFDLYYNGVVLSFSNGDKLLEREIINYTPQQPDQYHIVQQGDTITQIAWRYYKNLTEHPSRYWKYIADANQIMNPMDLTELVGSEIRIPDFNLMKLTE